MDAEKDRIMTYNTLMAVAKEEGHAEGKVEGAKEEKITIAKNLLKSNVPIDIIISATNLSKEQVEGLLENN